MHCSEPGHCVLVTVHASRGPGDVLAGWSGPPDTKTRAVRRHEFGLDLPAEDRKALIAFLRIL
jgi:hypothetical protein